MTNKKFVLAQLGVGEIFAINNKTYLIVEDVMFSGCEHCNLDARKKMNCVSLKATYQRPQCCSNYRSDNKCVYFMEATPINGKVGKLIKAKYTDDLLIEGKNYRVVAEIGDNYAVKASYGPPFLVCKSRFK